MLSDPDFIATARGMRNGEDWEGDGGLWLLPYEVVGGMTASLHAWPTL